MIGALKFENKPLIIRWYLLTTSNTTIYIKPLPVFLWINLYFRFLVNFLSQLPSC